MGLHATDLKHTILLYQSNTIGGGTYYIGDKPKCLSHLREQGKQDQYCSRVAGHATDHKGTGRCKYHGGRGYRPPTHGRYAKIGKQRLQQTYEKFADDPALLDLKPELVLQRTLLSEYMEQVTGQGYSEDQTEFIVDLIDHIGRTVERIDKIESKQVLTVGAYRYIMARAITVIQRFLPEERLSAFIAAWQADVMSHVDGRALPVEEQAVTVIDG